MRKIINDGYELESINIVQAAWSGIDHRNECDPKILICDRKLYPVIVAPMGSVTNMSNYNKWLDAGFMCVMPRTVDIISRLAVCNSIFSSFSLEESNNKLVEFLDNERSKGRMTVSSKYYICVDVAHGTMSSLYNTCENLKSKYGNNVVIMTGNVANPDAYDTYDDLGIDYMRVSIGNGSRCTTSCNVGVHYPTATLIETLASKRDARKTTGRGNTKIIADGGIYNFDDIQKCIALGADAVMSGRIFAASFEACEPIFYVDSCCNDITNGIPEDKYLSEIDELRKKMINGDDVSKYEKFTAMKPYRMYYGMSTKLAQRMTGGCGNKTAEGIIKPICVEYHIDKWADNMKGFLISAMSYVGARTIEELRDNTQLVVNLSTDKVFRK